jgi:SAM-dependent methyltransferase/uncharacterized protein YbaR (Trm112 family)
MDQWLMERLVCPRDHGKLTLEENVLSCTEGHRYPVIDGVPVMLLDDVDETLWVLGASLKRSQETNGKNPLDDPFPFADTQGISPEEYELLMKLPRDGVDPMVQVSIGRTCGNLYMPLVGRIDRYPIPELRLPPSDGESLVDVGCNWGRWSIAGAKLGYNVTGIDPSLGAVFTARRVCEKLGVKARFVVGDGRYLPFADGAFDVGFSYGVFQHFSKENARMGISELGRVTRDGGKTLVQLPHFWGIRCLYNNARRGFSAGEGFDVRFWKLGEMKKWFTEYIGKSRFSVDAYFGIGIQESDAPMLTPGYRFIVRSSGVLRKMSNKLPFMKRVADSIYVHSIREVR